MAAVEAARKAGAGVVVVLAPAQGDEFSSLAAALGLPHVNVSLELSRRLLDAPVERRPLRAAEGLPTLLDPAWAAAALGRLGLLHAPALRLNVLAALEQLARSRVIVAEWAGVLERGQLVYARPGHDEYRVWPRPAATVVPLSGA